MSTRRGVVVGLLVCIGVALPRLAMAQSDACASATALPMGTVVGNSSSATSDGSSTCSSGKDVWYRYDATSIVQLDITTCGSSFDTVLSVHSACPGTTANQIACNDDPVPPCGGGSRLRFLTAPGQTYYVRVAGFSNAGGSYTMTVTPRTNPADVYVGNFSQVSQTGRAGSEVAILTDSPICNAGDLPLDWYGAPIGISPHTAFNMYRLKGDRLQQIGMSWTKQSNSTSQDDWCAFGCLALTTNQQLGPGCSDTYEVNINQRQFKFGPRREVNAWTGAYDYATSFIVNPPNPANAVERLCRVQDADLNPATNAGAQYFMEVNIQAHDDANHLNSVAHRRVSITGGAPGGTWTFGFAAPTMNGPITQSWPGSTSTSIQTSPATDGRCILAAKVTPISPGRFHFEYALYNHDMERGVRSFAIPVGAATNVTNIGFSAPVRHGEQPGHNNAWTSSRVGELLVWQTDAHEATLASNPLRWGTLYNFWFDADVAAPVSAAARLGLYTPGTPAELRGTVQSPIAICAADLSGAGSGIPDGGVDIADLLFFLAEFEAGAVVADLSGPSSGVPDGGVDINDLLYLLEHFEAGC